MPMGGSRGGRGPQGKMMGTAKAKDFKGSIYCADIVSAYRSLVECSFDSLTKINKEPLKKALNKCKLF